MLIYKLLACFAMIVAMSSAEDFLAPMSSRNMTDALEVPEPLGPSIPDDSVFVPHNVSRNHLMLAFKEGKFVSGSDLDACKSLALSEGADVYTLMHGTCALVTLDFPLCSSQEGDSLIYVRKDLLSDGSPEDGATLDQINQIQGGPVIQSSVKAFRVQGPTVLQIDTSRISYKPVEQSQMYVTDNGGLKFVKGSILVDPSCYTSSTCGTPVVDFGNQINNHPYVTLTDYCGGRVAVEKGQQLNILSHNGIGCEFFPAEFPLCRVNYRGFGGPLKITLTYVNFVGDDHCNGFAINIVTFNNQTDRTLARLCSHPQETLLSPLERGRIDVGGSAKTNRTMYGFIINISYV